MREYPLRADYTDGVAWRQHAESGQQSASPFGEFDSRTGGKREPLPSAFSRLLLRGLALIGIITLALALTNCTRCASLQSDYRDTLRVELAMMGTGRTVDAGRQDHLRLIVTPAMLEALVGPLTTFEPYRAARVQRVVVDATSGARVLVDLGFELVVTSIRVVDAPVPTIEVTFRFGSLSSVRVRDGRRDHTAPLPAQMVVTLPLHTAVVDGAVALQVRPRDATLMALALDHEPYSPEVDDIVASTIKELVEGAIIEAPENFTLLRFGTFDAASMRADLAPSSLATVPERDLIVLGAVTSLRPRGAPLGPVGATQITDATHYLVEMHLGLPEAFVSLGSLTGVLPRTIDASGVADATGAFAITMSELRLVPGGTIARFDLWCLGGERCYREPYEVVLRADTSAPGAEVEHIPSTRAVAPVTDPIVAPFTARLLEVVSEVLAGPRVSRIYVGDAGATDGAAVYLTTHVSLDRIEIHARLRSSLQSTDPDPYE